ncbi:MAG: M6 family metalloprotease domain-containing protein [Bacteroidales bacterium]|nr:M6 family metalloprotease domain-containing protein [Bacteroidales bacterium]
MNNYYLLLTFILLLNIVKSQTAYFGGIPASPAKIEVAQPNGNNLSLFLKGDETVHWATTTDGYTLLKNPNLNAWTYAILDHNGELMPSNMLASNINQRDINEITFLQNIDKGLKFSSKQIKELKQNSVIRNQKSVKAFPTTGTVNMLVILVNFNNTSTTYTQTNFDNLMNQNGYNFQSATGSFKDYYLAASYNQLTINSTVIGWVTVNQPHDYYGDQSMWGQLAVDAINAANAAYPSIDFSQFDNDHDGIIDGIAIFHQGPGQEATSNTNDVWSHTSSVYSNNIIIDGVRAGTYTMQPEKLGTSSSMITVGVMIHEFGHNLGLPDLYDTDYSSDAIGNWDVMAGGSWLNNGRTPPIHNAWSKYVLGWLTPVNLTNPGTYTLNNNYSDNTVYKVTTTTTNEYFLLENKQKTSGSWNAYLPGHGMIIYHIDGSYINSHWSSNTVNDDENHQGVDIEEADGTLTTNNGGDGGDPFPGTSNKTSFTDQTTPNSHSWAGANTNKPITSIQESNGVITFVFMGGASTLTADFYTNTPTIQEGQSVTFSDMSTTPTGTTITSWQWSFPGGNPSSYTGQTPPAITYTTAGSYNVSLTVTNSASNTDTETKTSYITVTTPPKSEWITQYSGFTTQYRGVTDISIVDANTAWGIAIDGNGNLVNEFTKTTDGGNTWTIGTINGVPTNNRVSNICAISATKAWIAMYASTGTAGEGGIFTTSDGGATWTKQTTASFAGSTAFPNVVHFWNQNEGFCMGDPNGGYFEIYTTSNGGNTWTRVAQSNIPAPLSGEYGYTGMYDVYGNTVWFATNKGRVFKSTNKGATWTVSQVSGFTDFSSLAFNDANNGIATQKIISNNTITDIYVRKTTDGGNTWTTLTLPSNVFITDFDAIPGFAGKWVSVGKNLSGTFGSSYSEDFGQTWITIDSNVQYISCKFLDNNTGWAGGFNTIPNTNGIYKWHNLTNINNNVLQIETLLYPNPTHNLFYIYTNTNQFFIEIYDLMGKLIFSHNSNQNTININTQEWIKGCYIVKIISGNAIKTEKLIVQ